MKKTLILSMLISVGCLGVVSNASQGGGSSNSTSHNKNKESFSLTKNISKPIKILPGKPIIDKDENGVFVWLDSNGLWHLEWQAKERQLVWVRITANDVIDVLSPPSALVKIDNRNKSRLIIHSETNADKTELVFSSPSNNIEIQARWNHKKIANKLRVSESKFNSSSEVVNLEKWSNE